MNDRKQIPYASQEILPEDIAEVVRALQSKEITRGAFTEAFENALCSYTGAPYALLFSSGSAALEAAYQAVDITPYDRILTSANTFVASVAGAAKRGASLFYIDLDPDTGSLSLNLLLDAMNQQASRGREVIVPIHFGGVALDMSTIYHNIKRVDTIIIEDAAHAFGSCYPTGEKVGCSLYSDMTVFSFHPAKQITTGEGGAILTQDETLYKKLKAIRNNGIVKEDTPFPWLYQVTGLSSNSHMTDFQAALGLSQLSRIDDIVKKRRTLVQAYREALKDVAEIQLVSPAFDERTSYHLLVAKIDFEKLPITKEALMHALKEEGVGSQTHYIPLYHHPEKRLNSSTWAERLPHTETFYRQELSLPLFSSLTVEEVKSIANLVKRHVLTSSH